MTLWWLRDELGRTDNITVRFRLGGKIKHGPLPAEIRMSFFRAHQHTKEKTAPGSRNTIDSMFDHGKRV